MFERYVCIYEISKKTVCGLFTIEIITSMASFEIVGSLPEDCALLLNCVGYLLFSTKC